MLSHYTHRFSTPLPFLEEYNRGYIHKVKKYNWWWDNFRLWLSNGPWAFLFNFCSSAFFFFISHIELKLYHTLLHNKKEIYKFPFRNHFPSNHLRFQTTRGTVTVFHYIIYNCIPACLPGCQSYKHIHSQREFI